MKLLYQNPVSKLTAKKICGKKAHLQFSKALAVLSPTVL